MYILSLVLWANLRSEVRGFFRLRLARSLGLVVATGCATAVALSCALIADLPDYNAKPGGGSSGTSSGSSSSGDGGGSDGGPLSPEEGGSFFDAPPSVEYLGCKAAADVMLLAYWKLDDGAGKNALDCTGNGRSGTHQGTTGWIAGRVGPYAINFNGLGSVDFGNALDIFDREGAMSITAWVNVQSFTTAGRIMSKGGGPNDRGWELNVENNGVATFRIAVDGNVQVETAATVPEQTWIHIAGIYEPSVAVRLFINGRLASENTTGVPAAQRRTTFPMWMGNRPGDSCCGFVGQIDDVRFFGKALPSKDVEALAAQ